MVAKGMLRGGIIAANDYIALEILRAAGEAGIAPRRDFLIVGVDDIPQSMPAGLSSVRPPLEQLGMEANFLLNRVVRHQLIGAQVVLHPQLIVRSSSRWIAGNKFGILPHRIGETMK
jgi:DNA-binding LacI/PurR family transcriptional regulator